MNAVMMLIIVNVERIHVMQALTVLMMVTVTTVAAVLLAMRLAVLTRNLVRLIV